MADGIILEDGGTVRRPDPVHFGPGDVLVASGSVNTGIGNQAYVAQQIGRDINATKVHHLQDAVARLCGGILPPTQTISRHLRRVIFPDRPDVEWYFWAQTPIYVCTAPQTRIVHHRFEARWEARILVRRPIRLDAHGRN